MSIFKTKKNRRYNYTPRFYKGEQSPFEIKHKFDDQRVTIQAIIKKNRLIWGVFSGFLRTKN